MAGFFVKWGRSHGGRIRSKDGRFEIRPVYRDSSNPEGYELHRVGREGEAPLGYFERQSDVKTYAERVAESDIRRRQAARERAISAARCGRCGAVLRVSICSTFNTEQICLDCKREEEAHPEYAEARRVEAEAVRDSNYNFAGVGLPADLRRAARLRAISRNAIPRKA